MKYYYQNNYKAYHEKLQSHLIPINELANGGYVGLSDDNKIEKLKNDFEAFKRRRAELVMKAVKLLADGHQLSAAEIYEE